MKESEKTNLASRKKNFGNNGKLEKFNNCTKVENKYISRIVTKLMVINFWNQYLKINSHRVT